MRKGKLIKTLLLSLCLALTAGIAACGGGEESSMPEESSSEIESSSTDNGINGDKNTLPGVVPDGSEEDSSTGDGIGNDEEYGPWLPVD